MPLDDSHTFVARHPEDLVVVVPFLLRFQPSDSAVLLTFGGRSGPFHARVDLPRSPDDRADVVQTLVGACRTNRTRRAAVVVFSDEVGPSDALLDDLLPALQRAGVEVLEAVRADGATWWSSLDPELRPHPYDARSHPFTAEQVFAGRAAFGSREELERSVAPVGVGEHESLRAAARVVADSLAGGPAARVHAGWLVDTLTAAAATGDPLATAEAGRALALVREIELRDVAWSLIEPDTSADHVALWRDLVRRAPDELLPAAASLLAFAAWLAGDGALSWCALDRCLRVDPEYSMARLVGGLLQGAVAPATWSPPRPGGTPVLGPARECAS